MNDIQGFKTSVEEASTGVVHTTAGLELEGEPEDVIALLYLHYQTQIGEDPFDSLSIITEIDYTPGEDAVNKAEMTEKDSVYYINLVDQSVSGFERIDFNLKEVLLYSPINIIISQLDSASNHPSTG